jgi:hypothetical protein
VIKVFHNSANWIDRLKDWREKIFDNSINADRLASKSVSCMKEFSDRIKVNNQEVKLSRISLKGNQMSVQYKEIFCINVSTEQLCHLWI